MGKISTIAFLAIWSVALVTPLAVHRVLHRIGLAPYSNFSEHEENRHPSPRPSLRRASDRHVTPARFGRAMEDWYNDSFPWRTEILAFQRRVSFKWLKAPVSREVPGRGEWVFRRGGDWPELDDYLGAFELTDDDLSDWVTLFEGRREWASAIGSAFLTFPSPVKPQVRWQELYPALRGHRGRNVAAQVREALADSPARDDVIFANDDFCAAFESGREVFFDADHHPSVYGQWLLYDRINRRLAELFPGRVKATFPWYDTPPPAVLDGREPGCWPDGDGDQSAADVAVRLAVSSPGETIDDDTSFSKSDRRYPYTDISMKRAGGGISVFMAHDSYMRYTLSSWCTSREDVRFPFAAGVGSVYARIFSRLVPGSLYGITADSIPDVIIEQFPECRLDGSARRYLDDNLTAAAVFGRARQLEDGDAPRPNDRVVARVVFDNLRARGRAVPVAALMCGTNELARRAVKPGVRRAVFFDAVEMPADEACDLRVELPRGTAGDTNLMLRILWRACGD